MINSLNQSPFLCLWGLSDGSFLGVSLLSLWRLSVSPVEAAVFFGPGFIPIADDLKVKHIQIIIEFHKPVSVFMFPAKGQPKQVNRTFSGKIIQ